MTAGEGYVLDGLQGPAEILVDRWGVPHLYASSLDDVFRVQGFNAARDRLWQLDFWRRRGLGLLAEVLGPSLTERDRATRLFVYRGDMHAEWLAYGPDTKRVANSDQLVGSQDGVGHAGIAAVSALQVAQGPMDAALVGGAV